MKSTCQNQQQQQQQQRKKEEQVVHKGVHFIHFFFIDSTSSDTDSDGYEIPPDAAAGYLEPATTLSSDYSRDRKYTTTLPNTELENVILTA